MHIESIPETEAQMSVAEIFLANGRLQEARRHLEILGSQAPDSTRVSYYRGVLAQIAGEPGAREFFVDALLDPFLAARAAVQLVAMGDTQIPAVRTILQEAADSGTRNSEVYLALAKIYAEEVRRIEEAVRLNKQAAAPPVSARVAAKPDQQMPDWRSYMRGAVRNIGYDLLSDSDRQPRVTRVVVPYYPPELLEQKVSGEVVIDVQVTDEGKVGGIWLVSAMPEVFGSLATASVHDWEFEGISGKIRVVLGFNP
jgi:hypothetical protein